MDIIVNNLYFIPGIIVVAVVGAFLLLNFVFDNLLG
jgi:hypothetical protein